MKKRTVLMLQGASALSAMGYGAMFAVLDDFRDKFGITESRLGILVGVGFFTGFIAQILFAPLADKGKAKRLIMIGLALEVVGNILMAFGNTFTVLFIARTLMGLGGGIASPAVRRIIILADPGNMGSNLGRMLSADVGGFALGPVVAAITVGTFGLGAPFLIITALIVVLFLGLSQLHVSEANKEDAPSQRLAFDLLKIKPLAGAIIIGLALFVMIGTFDSIWSVMMADMKAPSWIASVGITLFALPMLFLGPIGGRLTQRVGPFNASMRGLTLGALCMICYGTFGSPYAMLVVGICHGVIDGLTVTGGSAAVALVAPHNRLASAQGLYGGLQTLTGGITAIIAGASYDAFGRSVTYIACAIVMVFLITTGAWMARSHLHIKGELQPESQSV